MYCQSLSQWDTEKCHYTSEMRIRLRWQLMAANIVLTLLTFRCQTLSLDIDFSLLIPTLCWIFLTHYTSLLSSYTSLNEYPLERANVPNVEGIK